MDTTAVMTKAQFKLKAAERAIRHLERGKTFEDKEDAWQMLIYNLAQVSDLLFKLSGDPRAKRLVDEIKSEQGSDPLLQYVFQARNSETHNLIPHTQRVQGVTSIKFRDGSKQVDNIVIGTNHFIGTKFEGNGTDIVILSDDPQPQHIPKMWQRNGAPLEFDMTQTPGGIILAPAVSRGTTYSVPTSHKGVTIDQNPLSVAHLAVQYYGQKFRLVTDLLS